MNKSPFTLPDVNSKADFVRQGFDAIAANYDLLNDLMTFGRHRSWKREAIARLQVKPGMTVLDFCAGTGDLTLVAAQKVQAIGRVAALDFSSNMIRVGRERTSIHENIYWVNGDAGKLPFLNDSFEGAVVGFGLRNVMKIEAVIQEVHRTLKSGGWLVSLDTAGTEWKIFSPFYRFYMRKIVPRLGKIFAGSQDMYGYLSASAAVFHYPAELAAMFEQYKFIETGYVFRPRFIGGAALVWGKKA